MEIIYTLWLRQIRRYLRNKSRVIGFLGQPLIYLLGLGFGMKGIYAKAGEGNYLNFLTPGILAQTIIFVAVFSGVELIWDKEFGFLKETLVAPVSRIKIILGRTLGGATIATLQGLFVFLLSLIIGFKPVSWLGIIPAIGIMFLVAFLYTNLGTAIASVLKDFHGFQLIMTYLIMPSFFLSGALFPIDSASKVLQKIIKINPLTYGVDSLRQVLICLGVFNIYFDLLVLGFVCLVFLMIAVYLFSKIEIEN